MRRILVLLGLALPLIAAPAQAATITYEWVCDAPTATCDGDTGFSLQVMLNSSVVVASGYYDTDSDAGAAFSWSATSTYSNDFTNYNGFSMSGGLSNTSSVDNGLQFYFDADGVLTGLRWISEGLPGNQEGNFWAFLVSGVGEIGMNEILDSGSVYKNTVTYRQDRGPTCSGGTPGCPSNPKDTTIIYGHWERVAVPEPASLTLLGLGLLGVGLRARRRR